MLFDPSDVPEEAPDGCFEFGEGEEELVVQVASAQPLPQVLNAIQFAASGFQVVGSNACFVEVFVQVFVGRMVVQRHPDGHVTVCVEACQVLEEAAHIGFVDLVQEPIMGVSSDGVDHREGGTAMAFSSVPCRRDLDLRSLPTPAALYRRVQGGDGLIVHQQHDLTCFSLLQESIQFALGEGIVGRIRRKEGAFGTLPAQPVSVQQSADRFSGEPHVTSQCNPPSQTTRIPGTERIVKRLGSFLHPTNHLCFLLWGEAA